jgi:putative transcriptional regulator
MKKRNLLSELKAGITAFTAEREGKWTLKRVDMAEQEAPSVAPEELRKLREDLHLSRAHFARTIRTSPRTVESWEQGRSKPNAHTALLMKLVQKFPETLDHLRAVSGIPVIRHLRFTPRKAWHLTKIPGSKSPQRCDFPSNASPRL